MNARLGVLLVTLFAVACGSGDETAPPPGTSQYAELQESVFEQACTFACHSGGEFAAGGLDMQAAPKDVLVGVAATAPVCAGAGWSRVVAGDPEHSLLYVKIVAKLDDTEAPCGESMPSGANREPLTAAQVEQVRAWIAAGAPSN